VDHHIVERQLREELRCPNEALGVVTLDGGDRRRPGTELEHEVVGA
jgi:hypothetical protein